MRFLSLHSLWYRRHPLRWFLLPATGLYLLVSHVRRAYLRYFREEQFPVPVIVVGNVTVGGVGKTPLVIALALQLKARGLRVGIVSRGYGGKREVPLQEVFVDSNPSIVGDEPLLLSQKTACPVVVAKRRVLAVRYLLQKYQSQVILSDDGLQHYALGRAIEIAVVDGTRGLGNGFCLPAGPLRERAGRLSKVDFIVVNGGVWPNAYRMDLVPGAFTQLKSGLPIAGSDLQKPMAAVAAIGNPERFFTTLRDMGLAFQAYPFPDHYRFEERDWRFDEKTVVMTEKDAVKCRAFATEAMVVLPVTTHLSDEFWQALWSHESLRTVLKTGFTQNPKTLEKQVSNSVV